MLPDSFGVSADDFAKLAFSRLSKQDLDTYREGPRRQLAPPSRVSFGALRTPPLPFLGIIALPCSNALPWYHSFSVLKHSWNRSNHWKSTQNCDSQATPSLTRTSEYGPLRTSAQPPLAPHRRSSPPGLSFWYVRNADSSAPTLAITPMALRLIVGHAEYSGTAKAQDAG